MRSSRSFNRGIVGHRWRPGEPVPGVLATRGPLTVLLGRARRRKGPRLECQRRPSTETFSSPRRSIALGRLVPLLRPDGRAAVPDKQHLWGAVAASRKLLAPAAVDGRRAGSFLSCGLTGRRRLPGGTRGVVAGSHLASLSYAPVRRS